MAVDTIIVTGLPGEPGAILKGSELIAAVRIAAEAKAAGLEGRVYLVEGGKMKEFNLATKARGVDLAKAPWSD